MVWVCAIVVGILGAMHRVFGTPGHEAVWCGLAVVFFSVGASLTHRSHTSDADRALLAHRALSGLIEKHDPRVVILRPSYYLPVLHFYQTGLPIARAQRRCANGPHCYEIDGVRYSGTAKHPHLGGPMLQIDVGPAARRAPADCPAGGTELRLAAPFRAWLCFAAQN